jgi:hypothetical protein
VLEMGQDERRTGDVADFAGAGGDVLKGAPATGEQGEPAFAEAAQRAQQGIAGSGADVEVLAASGRPGYGCRLRRRPSRGRPGLAGQPRLPGRALAGRGDGRR